MSAAAFTPRRVSRPASTARGVLLALACLTAMGVGGSTPTRLMLEREATEATEREVKAACLYHFFNYVQWPEKAFAGPERPYVLLVVGKDPFGKVLEDTLRGKKVSGRAIEVRRAADIDELPSAHMVFLASSHAGELPRVLQRFDGEPVLLVGDSEGLAQEGAQVNLYFARKKLRFEVNTDAVKRSALVVSSQMLKLARIVHDNGKVEELR
jgi:hypothetical protein